MLFELSTEPHVYDYDPIACCLLLHNINHDPARIIFDSEKVNLLCTQHTNQMKAYTVQAQEIREFYKKKYMMYSLKGVLNTSFRRDLLTLLSEDKANYVTDDIRQLMSLPRMYHEDRILSDIDEKNFVQFYGMSSDAANTKHFGGLKDYRSSEGREVLVPYRGAIADTVQDILGGIRSSCTYVGAAKLKHLPKCATFIRCADTHNRVYE